MKHFIKVYLSSILFYICIFFVVSVVMLIMNRNNITFPSITQVIEAFKDGDNDENMSTFEKVVRDSKIINILMVGKENVRTDTIMLVSYDQKNKLAKILSIPRDTYYERAGYSNRQQKKINAIYQSEGIVGLKSAVEDITGLQIQKFISVDYEAVIKIVDMLDGIEFDVPMDMDYQDPMANPPLDIRLSKGVQLLNGENALKLLRFRQNNDLTGYPNGDLDRISTQQLFIKTALKKALGLKLPAIINEAFKYIDTDFTLTEILTIVSGLGGFTEENVEMSLIDYYIKNMDGLSYVIPNSDGIKSYVNNLYGITEDEIQDDGSESEVIEIGE